MRGGSNVEKKLQPLCKQVEERQEELVSLVQQLVRFQTPSPPARNTEEAQQFIEQFLQDMDFETDVWDVYPGDPNVVGTWKGVDPEKHQSLIINGHMDVAEVDKENETWKYGPFEPVAVDGRLYGRGTADMKGGLAGALFAVKLLQEQGISLPGDLIFQSVIGEEVGEAGTLECCKRGYSADLAVVVDTSDLNIQGQGGVITGWITVKSPQTYHDATRRNMIHAGGGVKGASAIEKMTKIIEGLQELEKHWAVTKSYPGFPAGMNTINPAVIEGGRHAAFVADECRLWITVHFYPDEDHDTVAKEVEDHIRRVADADLWLRENPPLFEWGGLSMIEDRGEIFPSLDIEESGKGTKVLQTAHQDIFGEKAPISMSPTVTDGGWLGDAGIPTLIYGPGDLQNAHAVNESVSIDQLVQFTKVMMSLIYNWCSTEREED
ncbi:acetylornithine deacetylase [Alteribacillus sp. YIM 98480]|uniref:acetylornithine deacetylase n=1 Tax=Alteribacillus sp. YIM 98480 TaxID=2606599 RepID=UPI00131A840C|nr:acetylornithine deacetylase [Alteribacillus sp. YIM 98480]